ncbi:MAG: DUF4349 domain-containing protein, partial [Bacillota bacterium]
MSSRSGCLALPERGLLHAFAYVARNGKIESLTARLNLLRNQTDYATVSVYLRSTPLAAAGISTSGVQGLWGRAVRALYGSLTVLIGAAGRAVVVLFA